jgi:hypothetical protein
VIPEGTVSSAQLTPPFPTTKSNVPVTMAVRQCIALGLIPVFMRNMGYRRIPTVKWRSPARISGGNDSTPMRIAK